MYRARFGATVAALALAGSLSSPVLADDDDYPSWQPSSETALSTTGPIILLPDHLRAGQSVFPWQPQGVAAQFKPDQGPLPARIFEVDEGINPELLNGRKLCGEKPVTWIVMVPAPPGGLEIDAFDTPEKPSSISSPGLCGTFFYRRW